jgi:hypothetical protein
MILALRWVVVVALGLVGALIGVLVGLGLSRLVVRFCPPELVVSGVCTASWAPMAETAAHCVGAAVSALLVVALPALVAPSHRTRVATAAFVCGTLYVLWGLIEVGTYALGPVASAIAAGAATLFAMRRSS